MIRMICASCIEEYTNNPVPEKSTTSGLCECCGEHDSLYEMSFSELDAEYFDTDESFDDPTYDEYRFEDR